MEILSREEAIARGLKTYFNGKDCKHGHTPCERSTSKDNYCTKCRAISLAKYRAVPGNKEKAREGEKRYRSVHKEEISQKLALYYKENTEYVKNRSKKYREENREYYNSKSAHKYLEKLRRTFNCIPYEELARFYKLARVLTKKTGVPYEVDHYYPINGKKVSGLHVPANLVVIPKKENRAKRDKMPEDFYNVS